MLCQLIRIMHKASNINDKDVNHAPGCIDSEFPYELNSSNAQVDSTLLQLRSMSPQSIYNTLPQLLHLIHHVTSWYGMGALHGSTSWDGSPSANFISNLNTSKYYHSQDRHPLKWSHSSLSTLDVNGEFNSFLLSKSQRFLQHARYSSKVGYNLLNFFVNL